jgi:Xaa-Pro aminopeptidase
MYEKMVRKVEPGVKGREVWEAGYETAKKYGLEEHINSVYLGHSTGATISERPYISQGEEKRLMSGQFLNIEPGIFHPQHGSACIENTMKVSESGVDIINDVGHDLNIV